MRHFCKYFLISLFTFLLGLVITSVVFSFTQIPDVKVISDTFDSDSEEIPVFEVSEINIQYYYTLSNKELVTGVFGVTNKTSKSVYYSGYDKNSHVENWINQNGKVTLATDLPCHNGVYTQELKPDETAIVEIPVPRNGKPFEAGFVFTKSINGDNQTVWVKVSEPNIFTQNKPIKHLARP